jgi:hypothetical protein
MGAGGSKQSVQATKVAEASKPKPTKKPEAAKTEAQGDVIFGAGRVPKPPKKKVAKGKAAAKTGNRGKPKPPTKKPKPAKKPAKKKGKQEC